MEVFRLNDDLSPRRLPAGRRDAIAALRSAVLGYVYAVRERDAAAQAEEQARVSRLSFAGAVHLALRSCLREPAGARLVYGSEFVDAVIAFDVASWAR